MQKTKGKREFLLTEKPFKLMCSLSLPAVIGMVVIGLYNFMDSIFVGQMVSPQAMGAISIAYPFTFINSGTATLIGVGSASVLSRAIGKKDQETIDKVMGNLISLIFILSAIITVLGMIFTKELLMLSGATGVILDTATKYLRIVFAGSLFVNFAQSANMVMRGEGQLVRAMTIMGSGAILNIALDPLMIALLRPYGMGAEGAAFATVIAQVVQAIITLWYFRKKSEQIKIGRLHIDSRMTKGVLGVGVSAMLMQVMTLIQQTVMYHTAANYGGDVWQILLGAALRLQAFAFIPLWGISQGFQPAAGTNFGAKEFGRVKRLTRTFTVSATVLALVFYIPIMCFPKTILSMFITDPAIVVQGLNSLRILFSTYITLGFMIMAITLFQSVGKGSIAAFLTIARQILFFIPLVIVLPRIANLGVTGVWLAPAITDVFVLIISLVAMIFAFKRLPQWHEQQELATMKK